MIRCRYRLELSRRRSWDVSTDSSTCLFLTLSSECFRKTLFCRENILPPVAGPFQAVQHISHSELHGFGRLQLLPGQGQGDRSPWDAPGRIGHVERLAPDVHVVVDEDLAGAFDHGP